MIKMRDVTKFISDTLNESAEFRELTQNTINAEFDYLLYADMVDVLESSFTNYISIATYDYVDELDSELSFQTILLVTIARPEVEDRLEKVGNMYEELTFLKLDTICHMIKPILMKEIGIFGINRDKNIKITTFNKFTPSPLGEDGLQMRIDIVMNKDLNLCSSNY